LIYLGGQTKNDSARENPSVFCEHASKYNLAVVFPDTCPFEAAIEGKDDSSDYGNS